MVDPKPAAKQEDMVDMIQVWKENVIRMARHGDDDKLPRTARWSSIICSWER